MADFIFDICHSRINGFGGMGFSAAGKRRHISMFDGYCPKVPSRSMAPLDAVSVGTISPKSGLGICFSYPD